MKTRYLNHDGRFGAKIEFTIPEMIAQYRICGWDEYEDENGFTQTMTDDEIEFDIMKHDIEELKNPAAVALGRLGGSVKSERKSKSSAENGKKGGRPRKPTSTPQ